MSDCLVLPYAANVIVMEALSANIGGISLHSFLTMFTFTFIVSVYVVLLLILQEPRPVNHFMKIRCFFSDLRINPSIVFQTPWCPS